MHDTRKPLPRGVHITVQEGTTSRPVSPIDGTLNLKTVAVLGEKFTQSYLVMTIQEVYSLQGVNINEQAYETIRAR